MHGNYRDRDPLDLAYRIQFTLLITGVCLGGYGEPCHSNQCRHGKGGNIKAHDRFFANGCRICHRELNQGKRFSREEKTEIWQRAHAPIMLRLWQQGYLRVRA